MLALDGRLRGCFGNPGLQSPRSKSFNRAWVKAGTRWTPQDLLELSPRTPRPTPEHTFDRTNNRTPLPLYHYTYTYMQWYVCMCVHMYMYAYTYAPMHTHVRVHGGGAVVHGAGACTAGGRTYLA